MIIAKLTAKTGDRIELCKYKIDTGSDGNLKALQNVQSAISKH